MTDTGRQLLTLLRALSAVEVDGGTVRIPFSMVINDEDTAESWVAMQLDTYSDSGYTTRLPDYATYYDLGYFWIIEQVLLGNIPYPECRTFLNDLWAMPYDAFESIQALRDAGLYQGGDVPIKRRLIVLRRALLMAMHRNSNLREMPKNMFPESLELLPIELKFRQFQEKVRISRKNPLNIFRSSLHDEEHVRLLTEIDIEIERLDQECTSAEQL